MPKHGSRWWSAERAPDVGDVVHDVRFKKRTRIWSMNDTRPYGQRDARNTSTPNEEWDEVWQPQPRIALEWINQGSVWRQLPRTGWWEHDRRMRVRLNDLVVVDRLADNGISLASVQPDGTLERYHDGFTRLTVADFMRQYARIWVHERFVDFVSPDQWLFPDVLYHLHLLRRETAADDMPTAQEAVSAIETIAEAEETIRQAKDVIKRREKAMKVKAPPRKRKPRKRAPKTAWEHLMRDD